MFRTSIFDVRDMDSFYWPYSRHHPGHIPEIAEGRAMGLDPELICNLRHLHNFISLYQLLSYHYFYAIVSEIVHGIVTSIIVYYGLDVDFSKEMNLIDF